MRRLFTRFNKVVIDHPYYIIFIGILLTAMFGYLVPHLEFSSTSEEYFIKNDPDKEYFEKVKKVFGNDQVLVIAMVVPQNETIYSQERILKIDRVTKELITIEGIHTAVSLTNIPTIHAPLKENGECCKRAIDVNPLIHIEPGKKLDLQKIQNEIDLNPLFVENLVSKDGRAAAVIAFVKDYEGRSYLYDAMMAEVEKILGKEDGIEKFYVAGIPKSRVEIVAQMIKDLKILLPLTFLLIMVSLFMSTGKIRTVILPLVVIVMTTVWSMGFMKVLGIKITLVSMILPPLMLALGSSYSIHIMSEYLDRINHNIESKKIVFSILRRMTTPIVVCGLTTGVGFASLAVNRIPAIQNLGIAAVSGIFFAVLIAITFMPAVLVILKKPIVKPKDLQKDTKISRLLGKIAEVDRSYPWHITVISILFLIICILGMAMVRVDTDFLSFFPKDSEVRIAADEQSKHLAGAAPFNLVLETNEKDSFKKPSMLKKVEELQKWAETEVKGIDTTLSMVDYVKLLNQAFHENDKAFYKIPDSSAGVSQILLLYSTSSSPSDFAPYITPDYASANVIIRSRLVGSTETNLAIKAIEEKAKEIFAQPIIDTFSGSDKMTQAPFTLKEGEEAIIWDDEAQAEPENDNGWINVDVKVTGTIYLMNKSANAVSKGQVIGLVTALLAIFVVMSIMFISPKIGFLAMIPNLFPIFALFGAMGLLDISLNFSTSLIAAISLGIGVDDTIQYINRYNREVKRSHNRRGAINRALGSVGKPMIHTSAALFFAFLILVISNFVPIRQFGFLSALTILVALASNLIILPTLMINTSIVTLWDLLSLEIEGNPAKYIKIFKGLSHHQARVALLMGVVEKHKEGQLISKEDRNGTELYVVLKGEIDVVMGEGDSELSLAILGPGEVVGERTMTRDDEKVGFAKAYTNTTVLIIDDKTMGHLEKRYPRISSQIYFNIIELLRDQVQIMAVQLFNATSAPPEE